MNKRIPRIGIGGPVGCGKSMLIERIVPILAKMNYSISIISNDVISQEDADRMRQNLATNQSAVLGMHNIVQRPVVVDGNVEARPVMYLALSYDHRIIDGKEAVSFLKIVKESLEQPKRLFLNI